MGTINQINIQLFKKSTKNYPPPQVDNGTALMLQWLLTYGGGLEGLLVET